MLDDIKLILRQASRLVQDLLGHCDLAQVMQERPQGQLRQLLFRQSGQHADEPREHRHINAVGKCIHIMDANISQLHQIAAPLHNIIDHGSGSLGQRLQVESPALLDLLEHIVHALHRQGPCLLGQDFLRRQELLIHHRAHHVQIRHP